jgi:N-acetyl-gamma-glutamyl-phosphate reductase
MTQISVAILGASGYSGAELLRLLFNHPNVRIGALTAERKAGRALAEVMPQFTGEDLPDLVTIEQVDWSKIDAVFCALPHGTTQDVIAALPAHLKIVDLSADFRLGDVADYAKWYGHAHRAPDLQKGAVYGVTELARDEVRKARLIANPGCYPTSAILPLTPLLESGVIDAEDIVIDAKSGVSGAGRALKESSLFCEVAEGMHAYGLAGHRHAPEIDQALTKAAGKPVTPAFIPHLIPMSRGMLSTIYVKLNAGAELADLRGAIEGRYQDEPFVRLLPQGQGAQTRFVRGSNLCHISVHDDRRPGHAIICSVIDNLVKGASGQAIQNLNVQFGFPETAGLHLRPMFP